MGKGRGKGRGGRLLGLWEGKGGKGNGRGAAVRVMGNGRGERGKRSGAAVRVRVFSFRVRIFFLYFFFRFNETGSV